MPEVNATLSSAAFAPARAILEKAIAERAFPGAAYGVLHGGRIAALEAVGRFTYDPDSPAIEPDTVFDLASVTKVVATTAAAMLLIDRGLFNLDTRVGDILPGFVVGMAPGGGKDRVTLRMLLAHTSGLVGYAPLFRACTTPAALLREILHLPLEAPPGSRTEYSDFGFILLGKIIEILGARPLDELCAGEIFAPLSLNSTRFCPRADQRPYIPPTEEDTTFRHRVIQGEVQDEHAFVLGGIAGHAGLFSNVRDLLGFAQCILEQGRAPGGKTVFHEQTIRRFTARQMESQDGNGDVSRALGWDVPTGESSSGHHFGPRSIGHLGYSGTSLWIDPDQSLAVALLTNRTWPDRSSNAIRQVRPAFHDAVVKALSTLS